MHVGDAHDRVADELARPVVGDAPSAVGGDHVDALRRVEVLAEGELALGGAPAAGVDGGMLEQQERVGKLLPRSELAQTLLWLTRFPTIPAQYLQGSLVNQPYPLQVWVAQIDPNKNAGEFWDALAIPPRPAFYLTVTIAMELGADAVLMNTAIAEAEDSARMAEAMKLAIQAGRLAYVAGRMSKRLYASASSPISGVVRQ